MTGRRWLVERKPDVFDSVGAAAVVIDAGSLCFADENGDLELAYAAGQWLTVSKDGAS